MSVTEREGGEHDRYIDAACAKTSHQRALFTKNAAVTAAPRSAADSAHAAGPELALYSNNVDHPLRENETFQSSNSH